MRTDVDLADRPDDPSNILAPVDTQLTWLREAGFADVDCFWKWRKLALLAGMKAAEPVAAQRRSQAD